MRLRRKLHSLKLDHLPHIENWIFDLDNTLYPASCDLFELIDAKMTQYIANMLVLDWAEARIIQKRYFRDHGTTLAGLLANHDVDPHHFLDYVHDIDMARLDGLPPIRAQLEKLPGRKILFTNGNDAYALKVLSKLGLDNIFDSICDIHAMQYRPKPETSAYQTLLAQTGIDPARSLFVEDMARNLAPAKALGMTTIWVNNGSEFGKDGADQDFIDHEITDVAHWLDGLLAQTA
jgi:putative hydrolase of the HAD superfamily